MMTVFLAMISLDLMAHIVMLINVHRLVCCLTPSEYLIDGSIACQTGDEVPWTGVWYPATGIEKHSLTFAIKGLRMQPAFRVTKTLEERERESDSTMFSFPETVAITTVWHPVIPSGRYLEPSYELFKKAGQT